MLNLIGGQQPLYYAIGDALDVSLYNQPGDMPHAFLLAPRFGPRSKELAGIPNPPPEQTFYDWDKIQQIGEYLKTLIPEITFVPVPYIAQSSYSWLERRCLF